VSNNFAIYPSLKDKHVLVTGGASGIGAEIVKAFVAQGARVATLDMDAKAAKALQAELGEQSFNYRQLDLRDIDVLKSAALCYQLGYCSFKGVNISQV